MDHDADTASLATDVAVAWIANSNTRASADDTTSVLRALHAAMVALARPKQPEAETPAAPEHTPAVSVRKSLASRDHIVSMIDGKPYRSLTRHLSSRGITPDEYRKRYGLKPNYPMIAPAYSEARSAMSKALGLGRKPRVAEKPAAEPAGKPRRRKLGIAAAKAAAKGHLGG